MIPSIVATVFVYLCGGVMADKVALLATKMNGGRREPEHHLPNFVLPFISGITGCLVFGAAAQNNLHFSLLLLGSFFILFGSLTLLTTTHVFLVESYPQWAGYVLLSTRLAASTLTGAIFQACSGERLLVEGDYYILYLVQRHDLVTGGRPYEAVCRFL